LDEEEDKAYVTVSREWRRIDRTSMEWKDSNWKAQQREEDSSHWYPRISSDGTQLAVFTVKDNNTVTVVTFNTATGFHTQTYLFELADKQQLRIEDVVTSPDLHVFWIPIGGLHRLHKSDTGCMIKEFDLPPIFPDGSMTGDKLCFSASGRYLAVCVHQAVEELQSSAQAEIHICELNHTDNRVDFCTVLVRTQQKGNLRLTFHRSPTEPILALLGEAAGCASYV